MSAALKAVALIYLLAHAILSSAATVTLSSNRPSINDTIERKVTLSGTIAVGSNEAGISTDIYVAVQFSNSALSISDSAGRLTSAVRPIVANWPLRNISANGFLSISLPVGTQVGRHRVWLVLVRSGMDPLNQTNWLGSSRIEIDVLPLVVYKTSYENKNNIVLSNPSIPNHLDIANMSSDAGEQGFAGRAIAFADFTQEGALSAIAFRTSWKNVYPIDNPTLQFPDSPAKLYFLGKNGVDGKWHDITSSLINDEASRYVCIWPSFVEIADLNNDGAPDAYIACTGVDFQIGNKWSSAGTSEQFVVLSQPDGSYEIGSLPFGKIYGHQSALGDIDKDGNVDILTVDTWHESNDAPFVAWGNGDGTFTKDTTRFPSDMKGMSIFGIRAVPVDGDLQVFVSGVVPDSFPTRNDGTKELGYGFKIFEFKDGVFKLKQDLTPILPRVSVTGLLYNLSLDVIYLNGTYYSYMVDRNYSHYALVELDVASRKGRLLAEDFTGTIQGSGLLYLMHENQFVFQQTNCPAVPQPATWGYESCVWNFQLPK